MRLDVWLHKVCLVKSRNQAKKGCQSGAILLEGQPVKESRSLRPGDSLRLVDREIRVLELPEGNVPKKDAGRYYEEVVSGQSSV